MHMLTCVYACVRVHIYSCTRRTEADNQQLPQLLPPCFLTQGLSWHWSASEPPLSASPAVRLQMHTVEFGLYVCPWGGRGCTMVQVGLWGQHGGQVGSLRLQCGSWESTSGGPYLLSHLAGQHLFLRPDPNSGPPGWVASTCCHLPQLHYTDYLGLSLGCLTTALMKIGEGKNVQNVKMNWILLITNIPGRESKPQLKIQLVNNLILVLGNPSKRPSYPVLWLTPDQVRNDRECMLMHSYWGSKRE